MWLIFFDFCIFMVDIYFLYIIRIMALTKRIFFFVILCVCLWYSISHIYAFSTTAQLSLEIVGFGVRHGTPNNVNLWSPTSSPSDQEISGQFNNYFRIEDLQWDITGHYTTIQCDGVHGSAGNTLTGVYLKAGNMTPTKILWATGNVHIGAELSNYVSIINPVTYLYKPTDISNAWTANKYWDIPRLKIFIPGWTPWGTYSGTIVFSFYMY